MNKSQQTKGKQATRGTKQILAENQETVTFYFRVAKTSPTTPSPQVNLISHSKTNKVLSVSNVAYLALQYLFFWPSFTSLYIGLFAVTSLASWLSFYFMKNMARPDLDESGTVLGPGSDLNMQGHISEYFKDMILFTVIVHCLSLASAYLWLTLLVLPLYVFVLAWKNFLGPWFFAPAPEQDPSGDGMAAQKKVKEKRKVVHVR